MSWAMILIPSLLVYAAVVYWLFRYTYKKLWCSRTKTPIALPSNGITAVAKRILDLVLILLSVGIVAWPPLLIVMAISQSQIPTWGIDISAFAGFKVDLNALAGIEFTGLRNPEISGKTLLKIDTSNLFAWYLFAATSMASCITTFFCVAQLRALLISLQSGMSFTEENTSRIKIIGIVIIAWNCIDPLLQYFGWGAVIRKISFSSQAFQLHPAFEINAVGLFIGLMMLVLAGVLREATNMRQEQELTI